MADKSLVIVESPTKARTITKFLGKDFNILASNGHIRDLPNSAAEIPTKFKKEAWARLGVNVEEDFEALYVVPSSKKQHVKTLKDALKDASIVYLATDEDREGESISWHLVETLKPKVPVKRLVFHEITKEAIEQALSSPRSIDENLVRAQETRRIVDRLYGYEVSPLLWKKMTSGLSAGRVQSVAIRLLVERERERIAFHKAVYWGLKGLFESKDAKKAGTIESLLTHVDGKRVAIGKDFDASNGKLAKDADVVLLNEKTASELRENVLANEPKVKSVEEKPYTTKPSAPFVTSTLQQEANRKLGFSAKRTMTVAQQLYENGFITYMRTDSTTLSTQALSAARSLVKDTYGESYLPKEPRIYKTKVKNAQEAHEAIRPAGESFKTFGDVKKALGQDAVKLYELIWKRTVASQMADAKGTYITLNVESGRATFRASGKTIEFPGFLRAYVEGSDDPDAELADQERSLPKVVEGEVLDAKSIEATEHTTQPPARYTEGSMIKELERRGIGRPSTWATVVETVLSRDYAFKRGSALIPTFTAMAVVNLLEDHFSHLLDYEFTARLEDDLDAISRGEAESLEYLKTFYFGGNGAGLKPLVTKGEESIDPREVCGVPVGESDEHGKVEVRIGRYGPFLTNGENRAALPDGVAPDEMNLDKADELLTAAAKGPESLGKHPETGQPIYLKTGRYGPYVQLGDQQEGGDKPKMASLLKGTSPGDVDLAHAVKLLSLPRTIGNFPDNGEPIVAANGRYGPYIKCGSETRSLPEEMTPIDVSLEQATELLRQPKKGRRRAQAKVLKELGKHPSSDATIVIKSGQYGPYVTDGEINASIPKNDDPQEVTLEQAINLIEARLASGKVKRKKKSSKKKASKKTTTKKASAKKTKAKKAKKTKESKTTAKKSKTKAKKTKSKTKSAD